MEEIGGVDEDCGFYLLNQLVAALRIFTVGVARNGENFAVTLESERGGDERAGTFWRFDDDYDFRKSGDDAISFGELKFIAGH